MRQKLFYRPYVIQRSTRSLQVFLYFSFVCFLGACVTAGNKEDPRSDHRSDHRSNVKPVTIVEQPVQHDNSGSDLEQSNAAVMARLQVLRTEADRLGEELAINASKRSAEAQAEVREKLKSAKRKLAEIDAEVSELINTKATGVKTDLKRSISGALNGVGQALKDLGEQVAD